MDLHAYTDVWVHDRRTMSTSVTTVNGAATPLTIKSARHNATSNGLRKRVDDCVYSPMTSDALPKMPPNTTIQYKIISKSSQLFQMTVPVPSSKSTKMVVVDCVADAVPSVVAAAKVNWDAAAAVSRSAIACDKFCKSRCAVSESSVPIVVVVVDDADNDDVLLSCCCWWWWWRPAAPLLLLLPLRLLLKTETYWFSCCKCHVESWPIIYVNQVI